MPTVTVITNNSAAVNGVVADQLYAGCIDTRLWEEVPGSSQYGGDLGLGNGVGAHNNSLISAYGLANLPRSANVISAVLHIKTGAAGFGQFDILAQELIVDAELSNATWNDRKPGVPWSNAGGLGGSDFSEAVMDTQTVSGAGSWNLFNVTDYVQSVVNGGLNFGVGLITAGYGGDNGFWFLNSSGEDTPDGDRWQIVVTHDGGEPNGNIPFQNTPLDFTGADGSPAPAPLVPLTGDFQIINNALRVAGSHPPGTIGWKIGADTGTPNGIVSAIYSANGGFSGDTGIMVRYVDPGNFWDAIIGTDTLYLVNITNGSIAFSSPGYTIPSYDPSVDYYVEVHLEGDQITVFFEGSEVIRVVNSTHHQATIHGAKYAGADSSIDNLVLPGELFPAGITGVTGVLAPFEQVEITHLNFDNQITSITLGGVSLSIDSQSGGAVVATIPAGGAWEWGQSYDLSVSDGVKTATSESLVLLERNGWSFVTRDDTALTYAGEGQSESFEELLFNDAGFQMEPGDQLQFSDSQNMLVRPSTTFRIEPAANVAGLFAVYRSSTGTRTPEYPYRWEQPSTIPLPFSFESAEGVALSSLNSASVTLSGTNLPSPISVSGPGAEYRIDSGVWTSADGMIPHGSLVSVRGVASDSYESVVLVTLTVGGVSGDFAITTTRQPASFLLAGVYLLPYNPTKAGLVYLAGNTMELFLHNLRDPSGRYINSATVEAEFRDPSGNPVLNVNNPVVLSSVNSSGNYRVEVPAVSGFVVGTVYQCTVTAVDASNGSQFQSTNLVEVKTRGLADESKLRAEPVA